MFFGIFNLLPNLLTTSVSALFPAFASYKALRARDPAQLTPWLMYWVVYAIAQTGEYWLGWAVDWFPFYAWIRLGAYCYLVLPGMQGAPYLYQTRVHPFLAQHEAEIDRFISEAHDNAKRAGLNYLNKAIEFVKVNVFGMPPRQQPPPPPTSTAGSYAQSLMSRFNLSPETQNSLAPAAGNLVNLLSGALQSAAAYQRGNGSGSREATAEALAASGALIPEDIARRGPEERNAYVAAQREHLQTLLHAYDREAQGNNRSEDEQQRGRVREQRERELHLSPPYPVSREVSRERSRSAHQASGSGASGASGEGLAKSKSELEFDRVEYDEAFDGSDRPAGRRAVSGGGWMPWGWRGQQGQGGPGPAAEGGSRSHSADTRGHASGTDAGF
ncbi:uncharacterized protein K452DRAFT_295528 [Aplosporella prunicola CBS 121167]|uniref:Protein YOP1 n=1 Tax=Aplosporella prunicola CBS 121167 TaxID=1176127 RepID=A0A6A6BP12_9PEZI|nr:uncharacterized protein K452DRAFT_295528 [Aplosporella prunicola CBS 121167]KAF2144964.1 hypothetical protein K452DRAFT_295528 [Aplosporella prunicola CBS 121167]